MREFDVLLEVEPLGADGEPKGTYTEDISCDFNWLRELSKKGVEGMACFTVSISGNIAGR